MRLRTLIGVTLAMAALVGCTPDGPPEGYQRIQTGWMQVDIPSDWVDAGGVNDRWTGSYQDAEGQQATVQLLIAPEWGTTDALMATSSVVATAQVGGFPEFQVVPSTDDAEADYALRNRVDFTYAGADGTYQGVLWGLADDDDHVVLAQLTGKDLDPALVDAIDASLLVTG